MRIVFDLDLTLCTGKPYATATPYPGVVEYLSELRRAGHKVIIYTARGMGSSSGNHGECVASIGKLTLDQLDAWGLEYDEIYFGKPAGDIYVDDKSCLSVAELKQILSGG